MGQTVRKQAISSKTKQTPRDSAMAHLSQGKWKLMSTHKSVHDVHNSLFGIVAQKPISKCHILCDSIYTTFLK